MSKSRGRPSRPRRRGGQPNNANAKTTGFYSDQFTTEELALVAAFTADPSLDDEIWMQRVLNRRLLAFAAGQDKTGAPIALETLVKVVEALSVGTGRVARLLRDRRVLSGEAADGIAGALSAALDEIGSELGVPL